MKLEQLTELARSEGLTTFHQTEIVASVGMANGHVYSTVKTNQLTSMVMWQDVLWIELRRFNEPFRATGHSPLPAFEAKKPYKLSLMDEMRKGSFFDEPEINHDEIKEVADSYK